MKILKGILEEQLENAVRLKKDYLKAIEKLGHGNIVKKRIYNNDYYYNECRIGEKVNFEYMGKLNQEQLQEFNEKKYRRQQYKEMIKELDKQISFLEKVLHLKEMSNV